MGDGGLTVVLMGVLLVIRKYEPFVFMRGDIFRGFILFCFPLYI